MSRKYKFHNLEGAYFVSFAVVYWIDVFTREYYLKVLADSLTYCRKNKGMLLYAYCFQPSHVHLIFRDKNEDPSKLLRDFKKHTVKAMLRAIRENQQESRKEWLLWMKAAKKKSNVTRYQFWQHNNNPIELWSVPVIKQKLNYIHKNPIVSGFVTEEIQWKYSSARNFADIDPAFEIDAIGFLG